MHDFKIVLLPRQFASPENTSSKNEEEEESAPGEDTDILSAASLSCNNSKM